MTKLEIISKRYAKLAFNKSNFEVGGGLSMSKFASNRHEDAKNDRGKLTFGQTCQLFKKATGVEDLQEIKDVINFAIPEMEWHHAGKLPKAYGGGMKKTYYINCKQIAELSKHWSEYLLDFELSEATKMDALEVKKNLLKIQFDFLKKHAIKVVRVEERPLNFLETDKEMDGKYGWFSSYGKSYKMPEYYTGWAFKSEKNFKRYHSLK